MKEISKGTRIINYLIDVAIISLIASIPKAILFFLVSPVLVYYSVFLVYYFFFEYFLGQTPGKMITKTIVVDMQNSKPSLRKVLYRTILRLYPFDGFSYLFGQEQGGHDLISKTRLKVKEDK
jgi:uncharacterized RDD family membrane protein YckC